MHPNEVKARLVSALEEIAELRKDAKAGEPVDQTRYVAAIGFAATILDDTGRDRLAGVIPTGKASIQVDDLDAASLLLADLVDDWLRAHKAGLPSKAMLWDRSGATTAAQEHERAADNLRRVIAAEDATRKAVDVEARWVEAWLDHGERRLARVALAQQAAQR